MDKYTITPQPDRDDVRRCARIERRIDLVRRAGEAVMPWARILMMLTLPVSVFTGLLPHDAIALARDALGGP
jgi:hypothetical protein